MSQSLNTLSRSFLADNAITAYNVVKLSSTGADVATANTDKMVGVAQATVAAAEQVTVRMAGTSKVIASAAISIGDRVTATTSGKVVADATDKHGIIGMALEAAAADGDIIEILLMPSALISL